MKKLFASLVILLFLASTAWGQGMITIGKKKAGGASPCPSGYASAIFSWNGDYTSDTDAGCDAAGSAVQGTVTGTAEIEATYGQAGNGFRVTAVDESLCWTVSLPISEGQAFTVWVDVNWTAGTSASTLWEYFYDTTDRIYSRINAAADPSIIRTLFTASSAQTTGTFGSAAGYTTIGVAMRNDAGDGGDDITIKIGAADWEGSTTGTITAFTNAPTTFCLGEKDSTLGGDTLYFDNLYILSGYQTAKP